MEVVLSKSDGCWQLVLVLQKDITSVVILILGVRHAGSIIFVLPGVSEEVLPLAYGTGEALEAHPEPHTLNIVDGRVDQLHLFFGVVERGVHEGSSERWDRTCLVMLGDLTINHLRDDPLVPVQGIAGEILEVEVFLEHLIGLLSSLLADLVIVDDVVTLQRWGPVLGSVWTRLSERLVDV